MAKITPIVIDFETFAIEDRPKYPPVPVGFSIKWPKDKKSKYWAWGHPTGNNIDLANAKRKLQEAWESNLPLLFHNAKFDTEVAEVHMGCKRLPWERVHDTLYLIFLDDPHADTFSLKPSANRLLGMPPEEQEAVRDWLVANQPVPGEKITARNFGAYIAYAPGKLVGEYADGDVIRTLKIFNKLYDSVRERGMLDAYDRERKCMPIFVDNERVGMRIDTGRLEQDIAIYERAVDEVDRWLRKRLKAPSLNLDSAAELADALDKTGVVTEWAVTKTGRRSTAKENMTVDVFNDPKVFAALGYRGRLGTCLSTFMRPWLAQAGATGGTINTSWNQVRQAKGDGVDAKGTRTGRPSSMRPNFLNVPKTFIGKNDGYFHPAFIKTIPELPLVRRYILPDKGGTWLHRDYNQQEVRILAHFEDHELLKAFQENPDLDIHTLVQDQIHELIGRQIERGPIKILNFGRIYGEGVGSMANRMRMSVDDVRPLRNVQNRALPGLPALEKQVKAAVKDGGWITTWGGRRYKVEPPKFSEKFNKWMSFEYKMLNYLIQGSAADCTKEALIRYDAARKDSRFLVTVYDEINISAPPKAAKREMQILREAMQSVEFDVLMRSDGKSGENWGSLTKYEEK